MARWRVLAIVCIMMLGAVYILHMTSRLGLERYQPVNKLSKSWKTEPLRNNHMAEISNVVTRKSNNQIENRFGGFQLVSDNATYVYAGYYDDRDTVHVKVIALAPRDIQYGFCCMVSYTHDVLKVSGHVRYNYASVMSWTVNDTYRSGYIICPVPREKGRPTHVSVFRNGVFHPKTNITVFPPSAMKNNITRCVREFDRNYSNVTQLVWNIELLRMYGVDRFVFYLWNQSETVLNMLRSYEADGFVELRNFTINQPESRIDEFINSNIMWGQISSYHDCLFSEMFSAKYIVFHDVDEAIIPKKHKTLVELGDDLFRQVEDGRRIGALRFRNTYFPLARNMTNVLYPYKDVALKYHIHPLLYTIHKSPLHPGWNAKVMVIPEAVEEMFIHFVEKFKPGWTDMVVDETFGKLQHYRYVNDYKELPETIDEDMIMYSTQLVSAVQDRFQRAKMDPA